MTLDAPRLPFSLDPLVAEARRRMRKRRVLILVLAVLTGGGAAGVVVAQSQSSGSQAAAACPAANAYVYEVPSYPAQPPTASAWPPGGNDYWGWMPRWHPLKVGNWLRVNGRLWHVSAIAALPGDCRFFAVDGLARPPAGTLAGRLILQPVG